jgi:6-pyruvoyltetrahydropterin/6-carboxytetrahydropterin synthase
VSPGQVEVTRIYHFSAAHQLQNPALTDAENALLYGPCARLHGHNYYLEVTLAGKPHPRTGMAIDLAEVDAAVHRVLIDKVDHQTLEGVSPLAGVITTGESLARTFWVLLAPVLPGGALTRVAVEETAKNRFEYRGERS